MKNDPMHEFDVNFAMAILSVAAILGLGVIIGGICGAFNGEGLLVGAGYGFFVAAWLGLGAGLVLGGLAGVVWAVCTVWEHFTQRTGAQP